MGFPTDSSKDISTIMKENGYTSYGEPVASKFGDVKSVAEGVQSGDELSILLDTMLIYRPANKYYQAGYILNGTPEDLKAGILKIFQDDTDLAERFRIQKEFKEKGFIK